MYLGVGDKFKPYSLGENMKSSIKLFSALTILAALLQPTSAFAAEKPAVVAFTMTPDTVDIATTNTLVTFDLTVSNPTGIASYSTQVTLTDGLSSTVSTILSRTDSPIQPTLSTVKFHGTVQLPSTLYSGVYSASAKPIISRNSDGTNGFSTDTLYPTSTSKVVGAEDSLLVRNAGDLNYDYATFIGPAYDKSLGNTFINPKLNTVENPIWKVGESFNPSDYYELTVSSLTLKIKANTASVCTSDGKTLKLIAVGGCSFTVYTDKTVDYRYKKNDQIVSVTSGRVKPNYTISGIATQSSEKLPLSIPGPFVYGPLGLVTPVSATPTVCYASGTYINVISGGTCTVNYSSAADSNYLASDVYPLSFKITRNSQTIQFSAPAKVELSSKSIALTATASSGGAVSFASTTPSVCAIVGSTASLLKTGNCQVVATQVGNSTVEPVSITQNTVISGSSLTPKKLICIKNGKSKSFLTKKCPAGYKLKK